MPDALREREVAMSRDGEPNARDLVSVLIRGTELGLLDNANLERVLVELETSPGALLPELMPQLQVIAFHVWQSGYDGPSLRMVMACLAWYLRNGDDPDTIMVLTETVREIQPPGKERLSSEVIHATALQGYDATHRESWRLDDQAPGPPRPVVELGDEHSERYRFPQGFTSLIRSRPPTTRFHGWLKHMDPAVLNSIGRQVFRDVFPLFGEPTVDEYLLRTGRLAALGIALTDEDEAELDAIRRLREESIPVEIRRHRRYAGGDGMLPRGCYSSVCRDARGDDGYCLSRELFAYVDRRVPGFVYVGDSTSAKLVDSLRTSVRAKPGYCVTWVLILPPNEPDAVPVYHAYYHDLFEMQGGGDAHAVALESKVVETVIDNVLDLRLPVTQQWFFQHFRNGDGHFLTKDGGTATEFYDLVPTLMDPTLGGRPETHAIGSWLRSSGVDALIYPSARSNASVDIHNGKLVAWHGWNLVDYRRARDLPALELIRSPRSWPGFDQHGVRLSVAGGHRSGSWRVEGVQRRHDELRAHFEGTEVLPK
jgi:hypothetical protein